MSFSALLLGSRTITTALSDVTITSGVSRGNVSQTYWDDLEDMTAVTLVAAFTYGGSGGTSAVVMIDTAFGSGGTWLPVARIDFATTSAIKTLTISGLASRTDTALTLSDPTADTAINGVLGDRLRARLTTVGTYVAGTQIDLRAQPR